MQTGLSAGRVQSVAVRLIVDREEERLAFRTARYWDLEAQFSGDGREFTATLARVGDERVATGKDFDANGVLTGKNARAAVGGRRPRAGRTRSERTCRGRSRASKRSPASSVRRRRSRRRRCTQEASRKLGFSTERTMQAAQRLFQDGHISYHRTDSTTLSDKALAESARAIREMFGAEYYAAPRRYQTKVKNAQEAHEAIRPTDFAATPASLEARARARRAADLRADLEAHDGVADGRRARAAHDDRDLRRPAPTASTAVFTAAGKAIEFAGFRRAYVEGSDDPAAELEEQETVLPKLDGRRSRRRARRAARLHAVALEPKRHETSPPARYTEASLIKELERLGIGRPSTYAPTIGTIERRGYVFRQGKALVPSFTAFAVTRLLREHFGDFVDVEFTAEMEEDLDEISRGEREWLDFLRQFYRGDKQPSRARGRGQAGGGASAEYPLIDVGVDPESSEPVRVRIGRYGPFLQLGEGGPGQDGVAAADAGAGRSDGREGDGAASRQGRRAAPARRRSARPA